MKDIHNKLEEEKIVFEQKVDSLQKEHSLSLSKLKWEIKMKNDEIQGLRG